MATAYSLYRAVDGRDGKEYFWLHCRKSTHSTKIALFNIKTAPSRIKHYALAQPSSITWETDYAWFAHADLSGSCLIDSWFTEAE